MWLVNNVSKTTDRNNVDFKWERLMYKLVLSGATGYIGKNFVQLLSSKYKIFCIVRKVSNIDDIRNIRCTILSYSDEKELYGVLDRIKPDVAIHLAGVFFGGHDSNSIGEMIDCNVRFSTVFLDAVVKAGCRRFVNTGSYWQNYLCDIYNPVNLYAATKQAFEDIIRYYIEAESISALTLTIFDTYGPGDNRKKILNSLMKLRDGESIDMSRGNQKLFLCYINDVIKAYDVSIERIMNISDGIMEKYSVRTDTPIPLREIVERLLSISGRTININWGALPNRNREIENPSGIGKTIPDWKPDYDLDRGLKLFSDSYLK